MAKFPASFSVTSPRYRKRTHDGWTYQVTRRETGVTYRRTVFSATIWTPGIGQGKYLHSFHSFDQADAAARLWIEEADARRREQRRRYDERVASAVSKSIQRGARRSERSK